MKMVVVVGVGALGSHVVQLLRNIEATIKIIDFDRVEMKNVASQFHAKGNVGKNKTLSLQSAMALLYGTKLLAVPHRLSKDNVGTLLGDADLVIDCLDNAASRRIIQDYVRSKGNPCLHGALAAAAHTYGRVAWDEVFEIDDDTGLVGMPTCENGEQLPFVSIVSSYIAHAAKEFLARGLKLGFEVNPNGAFRT